MEDPEVCAVTPTQETVSGEHDALKSSTASGVILLHEEAEAEEQDDSDISESEDSEEEDEGSSSEEDLTEAKHKGDGHTQIQDDQPTHRGKDVGGERPAARPMVGLRPGGSGVKGSASSVPIPPPVPRPPAGSKTARAGSRPASGRSASSTGSTPEPVEVAEGEEGWQVALVSDRQEGQESKENKELRQRLLASETSLKVERDRRSETERVMKELREELASLQARKPGDDDHLMDVGCQTVPIAEAQAPAPSTGSALTEERDKSEMLAVENDALNRKLKQTEGEIEQLRSDNKFLWSEQSTLSTLREENRELKTQLETLRASRKHASTALEQWQASKERPQTAMSRMGTALGRATSPVEGTGDQLNTAFSGATFLTASEEEEGGQSEDSHRRVYVPSSASSATRPKSALAQYREKVGDYQGKLQQLQQRWLPSSYLKENASQDHNILATERQLAKLSAAEDYSLSLDDDASGSDVA